MLQTILIGTTKLNNGAKKCFLLKNKSACKVRIKLNQCPDIYSGSLCKKFNLNSKEMLKVRILIIVLQDYFEKIYFFTGHTNIGANFLDYYEQNLRKTFQRSVFPLVYIYRLFSFTKHVG